jgi:hypothetical protein
MNWVSKSNKLNLNKQLRKSVQKLNKRSQSKWVESIRKLKNLKNGRYNFTLAKFKKKEEEEQEQKNNENSNQNSHEDAGLDESIKTKKKFMSNPTCKEFIFKKKQKLKEKLKLQSKNNKSQLKKKFFNKFNEIIQDKKIKSEGFQSSPKTKLKSYIYDNAIVHKDSKTHEGIILYQTGIVYFGKLNYQNRPNGWGILFENQGEFVYGKFTKGFLNGKSLTNNSKYIRKTNKNINSSIIDGKPLFINFAFKMKKIVHLKKNINFSENDLNWFVIDVKDSNIISFYKCNIYTMRSF